MKRLGHSLSAAVAAAAIVAAIAAPVGAALAATMAAAATAADSECPRRFIGQYLPLAVVTRTGYSARRAVYADWTSVLRCLHERCGQGLNDDGAPVGAPSQAS